MVKSVAIVGAGVSGLTCAIVFAERGYRTAIFAEETGYRTTSAAAAAIWFPYDAKPADAVIAWALKTHKVLVDLARAPGTGVSMIELRSFSRTGEIQIPDWAIPLGAKRLQPLVIPSGVEESLIVNQRTVRDVSAPLDMTNIETRRIIRNGQHFCSVHWRFALRRGAWSIERKNRNRRAD
jgi:hypothetical protein